MSFDKAIGEAAYNAYCDSVNWKSFRGEQLQPFEKLPENIRLAWQATSHRAVQEWIDRHRDATIAALDWVHLSETSVLVVRLDMTDVVQEGDFAPDQEFHDALRRVVPPGCAIFYAHGPTAIQSFSSEEMEKHGWVRKPAEGNQS
jgi:hypothetical protein